jgi:hypothetical protein
MSDEAGADLTDAAARLAGIADALGESDWRDELRRRGAVPAPVDAPPTWGQVALTGLDVVEGLAATGRWDDARHQAAFLADFFTRMRRRLHGVAGVAFEGLAHAARARDRDDLDVHADLIRELFGGDTEQVSGSDR